MSRRLAENRSGEKCINEAPFCCRDNINNDRGLFCRNDFVHQKSAMRWFGYTHFLLKGLEKVRTEWSLTTLAYNLKWAFASP